MAGAAGSNYLETEVMTATPQKLQLMLISAAIRNAQQARELWAVDRDEEAAEALVRCQQIVSEMISGLSPDHDQELVKKVAGLYMFVFRALVSAHLKRDETQLTEAIGVLEIQQDTWRQVCDQLGTTTKPPAPHLGAQAPDTIDSVGGASFEA